MMTDMKLLLTSNGISNPSLRAALEGLMGKPVEEAKALVVATGIHPFDVGPEVVVRLVRGEMGAGLFTLGWGSIGLLELSVLPSIGRDAWVPNVEAADVIVIWGGDPVFLTLWIKESGLAHLLPGLDAVYVGVSAGAICAAELFGETFGEPRTAAGEVLRSVPVTFDSFECDVDLAEGLGLVPFAVIPHYQNPRHETAVGDNARLWAEAIPADVYALDDQSGVQVVDGAVTVISEGSWELFTKERA